MDRNELLDFIRTQMREKREQKINQRVDQIMEEKSLVKE